MDGRRPVHPWLPRCPPNTYVAPQNPGEFSSVSSTSCGCPPSSSAASARTRAALHLTHGVLWDLAGKGPLDASVPGRARRWRPRRAALRSDYYTDESGGATYTRHRDGGCAAAVTCARYRVRWRGRAAMLGGGHARAEEARARRRRFRDHPDMPRGQRHVERRHAEQTPSYGRRARRLAELRGRPRVPCPRPVTPKGSQRAQVVVSPYSAP